MATSKGLLTKRALIDQANSTVVIITSIAAFIFVFSLVASKTLFSQAAYQNRVISATHASLDQLKSDIATSKDLKNSYQAFVSKPTNAIGGSSTGLGPRDGNNATIVLHALPSSYDFPALTSSLESLISSSQANNSALVINSITGIDDGVNQSANQTSSTPVPVPMPFELTVSGNYPVIQTLVGEFDHSIRPFQVQKIELSGDQGSLKLDLTAQTFYQPAKSLNISTKVIK